MPSLNRAAILWICFLWRNEDDHNPLDFHDFLHDFAMGKQGAHHGEPRMLVALDDFSRA
jgi:hypothetical protein